MSNKKTLNSKNFSKQIDSLLAIGKEDLVIEILKAKELRSLMPNILDNLKRKKEKSDNYNQSRIFSKTDLDRDLLEKLQKSLSVDTKNAKIIIDENMSAGFVLKSADNYIDATLETMLRSEIEKLIAKNY